MAIPLAGVLLLALAASAGEPAPAPADDEARIEVLVADEHVAQQAQAEQKAEAEATAAEVEQSVAAAQFPPPRGTAVALADIEKMKGYPVLVHTRGGGVRYGFVEELERNDLRLHVPMRGGYAEFRVPRRLIESIEAD